MEYEMLRHNGNYRGHWNCNQRTKKIYKHYQESIE